MRTSHRTLLARLLAVAMAMFLFAVFVLPPLYDLFCEITGIGGRTDGKYEAVEVRVDTSRERYLLVPQPLHICRLFFRQSQ